ncbi:hypothetical protein H5U35_01875, partial [Candidatus Aerophobetes bacterium]|nr:hypothetical protein [Candidatus Aerophobetes bacterium]
MKKQPKGYIFLCFILPAIFLFAEKLQAADTFSFFQAANEKEVSAFFYIEEKEGEVAYFYIEERKIKEKWQTKVAFLNGKINPKEVNGFIDMINLWYLEHLKKMPWFEEIEEPPSLKLD